MAKIAVGDLCILHDIEFEDPISAWQERVQFMPAVFLKKTHRGSATFGVYMPAVCIGKASVSENESSRGVTIFLVPCGVALSWDDIIDDLIIKVCGSSIVQAV